MVVVVGSCASIIPRARAGTPLRGAGAPGSSAPPRSAARPPRPPAPTRPGVGRGCDQGAIAPRLFADRGLLVDEVGQHRCRLRSGPARRAELSWWVRWPGPARPGGNRRRNGALAIPDAGTTPPPRRAAPRRVSAEAARSEASCASPSLLRGVSRRLLPGGRVTFGGRSARVRRQHGQAEVARNVWRADTELRGGRASGPWPIRRLDTRAWAGGDSAD